MLLSLRRAASIFWFLASVALQQWLVQMWSILLHGGCSQQPHPSPASCDSSLHPLTHSFIHLLSHSFPVPGEPGTQPALVPRDPGLTFQSTPILTRFCLVSKSPLSLSSTGHSVWASHIVIPSANLYGVAQGSANYSPGGQIPPAACGCKACELRMSAFLSFLTCGKICIT